ncbi:unnamed protein product [Spirodela intermedia]|uniref:Uncharacterized protein n=1 Tax=Spirodela intermedia TaxID=51605 RepID=A0A7I8IBH1_SPIIN|nr:unnamed protein product [Spirodela intermedia]CAA6655096.1 unnamed protein product [Spirodela intermedia]
MAARVSTLSDLIHRVACPCLNNPLTHGHGDDDSSEAGNDTEESEVEEEVEEEDQAEARRSSRKLEEGTASGGGDQQIARVREAEALMEEVFQAVAGLKRAYVGLQEAHSPWDPERMSISDAAVVAELKRLGRLRDRFRRGWSGGEEGRLWALTAPPPLREAVVPYEAALEDLRRDLKVKEAEVENLKERLRGFTAAPPRSSSARFDSGRKGRFHRSGTPLQVGKPTPELFRACMEEVREASKSFTSHFLSHMRAARWDIAAAVRSIVEASTVGNSGPRSPFPDVGPEQAKHAMESYVNRKLFHGFENETFYLEGTLSSLLNPDQHRQDCYAQYRDMRGMDPSELLGVLPDCQFGRFAARKYLAMEQRRQVEAGGHPRTVFYGEFLRLAKAVWLLHLLAFALDPPPSHFEASQGAEFHSSFMESVVRFRGSRVAAGWLVGFPVAPGFKLADGSVVRARVFLVPPEP